jgi:PAS domain S-box-containing protein
MIEGQYGTFSQHGDPDVIDDDDRERQALALAECRLAVAALARDIWQTMGQCHSIGDALRSWANSVASHIECCITGIWLSTGESAEPVLQVVAGAPQDELAALLEFAKPDVKNVISSCQPHLEADISACWRERQPGLGASHVSGIAIYPIATPAGTAGAIGAFFRRPVGNRDLHRLATAAEEMSCAFPRLRTHLQQREANTTLRALLRSAPLGLVGLDTNGNVMLWNRAAETIFGWSETEIAGRPQPVFPAVSAFGDQLASAVAGGITGPFETTGRRRDGTLLELGVSLAPLRGDDDCVAGIIATIVDVCGRKNSERGLLLQQSVARVLAGSKELDEAARQVLEAVCGNFGWARGEFWKIDRTEQMARRHAVWHTPGAPMTMFDCGQDKVALTEAALPARVCRDRAPVWAPRFVAENHWAGGRADAACGAHDAAGFPILVRGDVVGMFIFFAAQIDQPDNQLQQTMSALCSQIGQFVERHQAEMALETAEENLRQSQKMEALGLLAGGVAHDFNNLLTVIIGHSEIGQERLSHDDPLRQLLNEIELAGKRAAALTRQLLAFSRKQVIDPVIISINEHVAEMERMLRRLIGEEIELQLQLAPDVYHVKADPAQIEQIILNLIVNARDAMPHGGRLSVRTGNARPERHDSDGFNNTAVGPCAFLEVSDTGCGMDDQTKSRIFEPFFTTKGKDRGTGLGLSTVYGIVQQSGGTVTVESQLNHGTTFRVFLPRARDALQPREVDAQPVPLPRGTETVLVVDDEDGVRAVVSSILQVQGYTVLEAASGEEALELCQRRSGRVDLIVTDVIMPGMSGQELADHVLASHPRIRLLFISGYAGGEMRSRGPNHREPPFLHKPFTSDALARKVRQALDLE